MNNESICFDYETVEILPDGTTRASTEFYRDNFRVASAAFTERNGAVYRSWFVKGEEAVRMELEKIGDRPVMAFNIQFEMGVTRCRFPDVKLNWDCDVQRLVQLWDNGGDENDYEVILIEPEEGDDEGEIDAKKVGTSGFGLVKSAKRILNAEDHKKEAYEWIRANVPECKKGKEGSFLDRLPDDILERYNVLDVEITYQLYEFIVTRFLEQDFDWRKDHTLYLHSVGLIVDSEIRGIPVARNELSTYRDSTVEEIASIGTQFIEKYREPISRVERQRLLEEVRSRKTLKGRKKYVKRVKSDPEKWQDDVAFNPGSNKQLEALFAGELNIKPVFFTKKGSPSFKSAHLQQWGDGGQVLLNRRKRLIVQKQSEAILGQTEYDGRLHVRLRAVGTKTGRYAGSGGVNIQALARRDAGLMTKLLPDPGYIFVSSDMSAGEPSIITEYTRDPNYKYFCFDGIGKAPYLKNGVLMIDDIYLAYASVCDHLAPPLLEAVKHGIRGEPFADVWLRDPESVKDFLKKTRKNAKWECLGFGYGLGAKGLLPKAIEAGLHVTMKDCKQAFNAYWTLFSGIKAYAAKLEKYTEEHGAFVNPFGYRFAPKELRKCFNGMVQSSVSGLFHWYGILMREVFPEAIYVTTIHDENIYMVPEGREQDFQKALATIARHMNDELKWCIDLRFGAVSGANLYEAK